MNDEPPGHNNDDQPRRTKRGASPIRLNPPNAVPITDQDYEQAVTVLASMITSWWERQHDHQPEAER